MHISLIYLIEIPKVYLKGFNMFIFTLNVPLHLLELIPAGSGIYSSISQLYYSRHNFTIPYATLLPQCQLNKIMLSSCSMQTMPPAGILTFYSFVFKAPISQYGIQKWKNKHNILFDITISQLDIFR